MKKLVALFLSVLMLTALCSGAVVAQASELKHIDTLKVAFVPSREPSEIITVTSIHSKSVCAKAHMGSNPILSAISSTGF
ncbi:MAG: hypothetical protein MR842_04425 [Clostridiales bacterium]|nr:hypothetical protein [Clostridiales bacterium]